MNSIMRANYAAGRYVGPAGFLGPTTPPSRPDLADIAAMLTPIVRLARGPDWRVDIDWTTDRLIARNDSGEWTALALRIEIDDNRCGEILACVPRKPVVPSDGVPLYGQDETKPIGWVSSDRGLVAYSADGSARTASGDLIRGPVATLNPVGCSDPNCRVCQVWRDADSGALAAGTGSGGGSLVGTGKEVAVVNYDATPTTITAAHLDAAWEEVRRYKEVAAARLVDSRPIHDWGKSDPGGSERFRRRPSADSSISAPRRPVATFPARAMRARSPNDFRVGFVE